jgi:hypothetical protein
VQRFSIDPPPKMRWRVISPVLSNLYLNPLDQQMAHPGERDGAVCR